MIVDDFPQVRRGLAVFLELWDEYLLVGEAANGEHAVEMTDILQPDLVLMDTAMPVMDGVTAKRLINEKYPHIHVVLKTDEGYPGISK